MNITQAAPLPFLFLYLHQLTATSTSRAAFMHCLRWAAWCPFLEASELGDKQADTQLPLLGGPRPNPFEVMVYRATPPSLTPSPGSAAAPGDTQVAGEKTNMNTRFYWFIYLYGFIPGRMVKMKVVDGVLFCCVIQHAIYIYIILYFRCLLVLMVLKLICVPPVLMC